MGPSAVSYPCMMCAHRPAGAANSPNGEVIMKTSPWVCMLGVAATSLAVQAQTGKWPEKPVRIIIAAAPGGGDDFMTRLIAPKLAELLSQQFIAENRVGAGAVIGQSFVQKSAPDRYTLLLAGGSRAGARLITSSVDYDLLRDLKP